MVSSQSWSIIGELERAVARAAIARKMVPVLWETGGDIMRKPPYYPDRTLRDTLIELATPPGS
jgi:hypothetical protein